MLPEVPQFSSLNFRGKTLHVPTGTQGWINDMGIDGPTFVPISGYFLLVLVKVCPQKLAF